MRALIDLTGERFERLCVIRRVGNKKDKVMWLCKCDCGNETNATGTHLKRGSIKSCGCLRRELQTKHGEHKSRLYGVWRDMKSRCYDANLKSYKNYGGRGITVCDDWHDFANFREWAYDNGYHPEAPKWKCTLDRINNNGNYEPSNCRWVDMKIQNHNKRKPEKGSGRTIDYGSLVKDFDLGTMLTKDIAKKYGIAIDTVYKYRSRHKRGELL